MAVAALAAVDRGAAPDASASVPTPPSAHDALPVPGPIERAWLRLRGPPTIGLQVGHLRAFDHPDELAALRLNTGGHAAGLDEVDVNRAVVDALAARLEANGIRVDVLPATVPPSYRADVLISVHADASPDASRTGYKSAHKRPARNALEPVLKAHLDAAYLAASPLSDDDANVTGAMLHYYAFSDRRYLHAAHRATPGVIVELGYLSNPNDRAWLTDPDGPADALARGLRSYLADVGRWHPTMASKTEREGGSGMLAWIACVRSPASCI